MVGVPAIPVSVEGLGMSIAFAQFIVYGTATIGVVVLGYLMWRMKVDKG